MENKHKMGLNATWSMAVDGMIGGGIFSVLGFIIELTGNYAWISFIIAGIIALARTLSCICIKFSRDHFSYVICDYYYLFFYFD